MEFYKGVKNFDHRKSGRIGILLINLGTPEAPTKEALRPYLKQFLSDPRVIEISPLKWKLILNLLVLPFRPKRSAKLYEKVWTPEGSPLLVYSLKQRDALQKRLDKISPDTFVVELGMRIGNPSVESALEKLQDRDARRVLALPLFPQYSGTTTATCFDALADVLKTWRWIPEFRMITSYHDHPDYISALANTVREHWAAHGRAEKLLLSFHGIPKRYFDGGDPYFCHCQKTARLLVEKLELKATDYVVSFQSLFGREEWLRPYTNETLAALVKSGLKSVDVICPGFSVDCLETIEEIEEENKEVFLHAGGEKYHYIPALNDRGDHIEMMLELVNLHTQGWPRPEATSPETRVHRVSEVQKAANSGKYF